jgi:hypothetical protein
MFFLLQRPNLFAICNNTFSKWWEGWRMACRRVLSSTPLSVRGSKTGGQRGIETYKQGKQLIQVARIWQAGRGDSIEFIGVYTDANIVMGAESADFLSFHYFHFSFPFFISFLPRYRLARWFLARLIFDPEDGGDIFLRNVGSYTDYTVLYNRRDA